MMPVIVRLFVISDTLVGGEPMRGRVWSSWRVPTFDFTCLRIVLDEFSSVICLLLCLSTSNSPSQGKAECTSLIAPTFATTLIILVGLDYPKS